MRYFLSALCLTFTVACSGQWQTDYASSVAQNGARGWHLHDVLVDVPDTLTTTEQNAFFADADVVWHGEPFGDRKAQVAAILQEGIGQGGVGLNGPRGVDFLVTLMEFHALTPIARAKAPTAVHNIAYTITVVDDLTGEVIAGPDLIRADLQAFTGVNAIEAVVQGDTQKVRITRHLRDTTAGWLGLGPDQRQTFSSIGR